MKSHHTTLHQFTLLSRRGVRLHLKNQAQQESLKKHFLKTLIISPNPSILEIILCHQVLHWKNRKKRLTLTTTTCNNICSFYFQLRKIINSDTLLVMVFNLVIEPFYDLFLFLLQYPMYPNKFVFRKTCV
jgi:hypothetical protein